MLKIPLGQVAEDQIPNATDSMLDAFAGYLKPELAVNATFQRERILTQYEVAADNKTVRLKVLKSVLSARVGFFDGFDIRIYWHRNRPNELAIGVHARSRFTDYCFTGIFIGAAVIAGAFCVYRGRFIENEMWLLLPFWQFRLPQCHT